MELLRKNSARLGTNCVNQRQEWGSLAVLPEGCQAFSPVRNVSPPGGRPMMISRTTCVIVNSTARNRRSS